MCICCYCLNNTPKFKGCTHSCCKDGKPCKDYKQNDARINKDKTL